MSSKTLVAALVALVALTGCGMYDRSTAIAVGYAKVCVDGVEYIQFSSGTSVAYTPEGKIKVCK